MLEGARALGPPFIADLDSYRIDELGELLEERRDRRQEAVREDRLRSSPRP